MRRALGIAVVSLLSLSAISRGQTSSVTYNEMATNQLSPPLMVTVTPVPSCSVGATTWTYAVAALDANGGTTPGTSGSTSMGCATLGTTVYNKIVITAVTGSAGCNVYRTSGLNTGIIATVPCGSTYFDMTGGAGDGSSVPGVNSTGSVVARGTVTAQNFLSSGTGAGTSDWVAGSALPLCTQGTPAAQPQPCIQANSFFLQAPPSPITAFGWTAPSAASTVSAPLIVGQSTSSSGVPTSALSYGFTDTAGTITTGDLATYTGSATIGNCTSLPCNPIIGVFTSSNPASWIASGETIVNLDATVNVIFNDILCASATMQGTAHDNGSIACTTGEWVGIAKTTSTGSVSSTPAFVVLK
jgi:hypothetical protein